MSDWFERSYRSSLAAEGLSGSWIWDEASAKEGGMRPHWRKTAAAIEELGQQGLRQRWEEAERLIEQNGVTYNVYGDQRGTDRPWPLDPIPFVVDAAEWRTVEAAIVQRARLLDAILGDLYGPRRLLRDRLLPPSLVLGNPHLLRACHGIRPPGGAFLHIYSADLARSPDGQWWVLADRTQGPSGAGYALENRMVTSRVMPEVLAEAAVRPLAGFFQTFRDSLARLAPRNRDNPRIVLLTPGPYNETYFEHSYLARHLGFTLVEGGDLTVRDRHVYVKTLGGLLPVDVIARRQDDNFCDPLELREDSMLGVPGLVHAVRAGNVTVANALGTGLTETSAMCAFLPGLCRAMFGEELKMPSVATWWCGQELPFAAVREQIGRLVIKPAVPSHGVTPVFGERLGSMERESLLARIKQAPGKYVAQELVNLSTAPVWTGRGLAPRRLVMRVYAVFTGDTYAVMPGALTRVSSSMDSFVVSVQAGGGSKDTWVLPDGPLSDYVPQRPPAPAVVSRATFALPSRVADTLFWLGRYCERIDSAVRLSRAILEGGIEETASRSGARLAVALGALRGLKYLRPAGPEATPSSPEEIEAALLGVIHDTSRRGGIAWMVGQLRRLAWLLRERISEDSWRVLYGLSLRFQESGDDSAIPVAGSLDLLAETILSLSAFSGLAMESMTRGAGWRFLDMGRRIERGLQVCQVLRFGLREAGNDEAGAVEALLAVAESSMTYRSRYLASLQTGLMLDLLLLDETNPRSVAFQLERLGEHVAVLPLLTIDAPEHPERSTLGALTLSLRSVRVEELARGPLDSLPELDRLLDALIHGLGDLALSLSRGYLSHATPARLVATA